MRDTKHLEKHSNKLAESKKEKSLFRNLRKEVENGAMQVDGIDEVDLQLVWDPPWTKDMMSEAAKLELNLWTNK